MEDVLTVLTLCYYHCRVFHALIHNLAQEVSRDSHNNSLPCTCASLGHASMQPTFGHTHIPSWSIAHTPACMHANTWHRTTQLSHGKRGRDSKDGEECRKQKEKEINVHQPSFQTNLMWHSILHEGISSPTR